jgi:hypothetical protein
MADNKRVFYACEAIQLIPKKFVNGAYQDMPGMVPLGVQSVGMTTNFNLEKIFTLGQLAQYESIENNPELEVTLNKVFDGTIPLYLLCMGGGLTEGSLLDFANNRVDLKFGIYRDTSALATVASGVSMMKSTGMYVQSVNFTFPTDGNATEDVTLVSSNREWSDGVDFGIGIKEKTAPGIVRRWKFNESASTFPRGAGGMEDNAPVISATVSADLNREPIYTLGSYEAYDRSITFPIEVNCEIESLAIEGDKLNLSEVAYGCTGNTEGNELANKTIKFVICGKGNGDSFTIDLGNKNKLTSVSYGGGEAGGGNLTITYSFTTDNFLYVAAQGTYRNADGCEIDNQGNKVCA